MNWIGTMLIVIASVGITPFIGPAILVLGVVGVLMLAPDDWF